MGNPGGNLLHSETDDESEYTFRGDLGRRRTTIGNRSRFSEGDTEESPAPWTVAADSVDTSDRNPLATRTVTTRAPSVPLVSDSTIRYQSFPRTSPPPEFARELVTVFRAHENDIATENLDDGLKSDAVLAELRDDLTEIGFDVEQGKKREEKIFRPVLFGENGEPQLRYEVDAYHPGYGCGLEVEAGRAWKGNAIYRDLIQAMMMVQVDTLALAVPNLYKHANGENPAYRKSRNVIETLYDVDRTELPFGTILIGY
jgi:hypothetical protein